MAEQRENREQVYKPMAGGLVIVAMIVWVVGIVAGALAQEFVSIPYVVLMVLSVPVLVLLSVGFTIVGPNMAKVLVLFGRYRGTVRQPGFYWVNPFAKRTSISLKAVNLASSVIKVNDLKGNPIEIGAVVVWQVRDTAQASFDVEDYRQYVDVQIETAVRQLASNHPYDDYEDEMEVPSLRGDSEQITATLERQLQPRLDRAGIEVIEARISHLAYAPEIASAMLQRQQAAAIIAARKQIVEGAVGMVEDALGSLRDRGVIDLDLERRATLVGNLLVVLCGQADAQPVINTGSLYN